jgi:hypothetical protein
MIFEVKDEREFWEKAFVAALTGATACDNDNNPVQYAKNLADEALEIWLEKFSCKNDKL